MGNFRSIVLLVLLVMGLSACEGLFGDIDQNKGRFNRSTDYLVLYGDGDWVEYSVEVFDNNTPTAPSLLGTLRVAWHNDTIKQPEFAGGQNISVLREVSTLDVEGSVHTRVRYITQNNDDLALPNAQTGTVSVHAYQDPTNTDINTLNRTYYWVSTSADPSTINSQVSLISPMNQIETSDNHIGDFNLFAACDGNGKTVCGNMSQTVSHTQFFSGVSLDQVETELGIFQQLSKIVYNFSESGINAGIVPPTLANIWEFCDPSLTNFPALNGITAWYHPLIGMIKTEGVCQSTTSNMRFRAVVRATNLTLPDVI